jgi:hypothetical protein
MLTAKIIDFERREKTIREDPGPYYSGDDLVDGLGF